MNELLAPIGYDLWFHSHFPSYMYFYQGNKQIWHFDFGLTC